MKVTPEKTCGFYNVYYQLYENAKIESRRKGQGYSALINLFQRCGSDPKTLGERVEVTTKTIALERAGRTQPEADLLSANHGGTVEYIRINPLYAPDKYSLNHYNLRIYIDGEEKPRFHGTGHEDEYQGGWSTFWLTNSYSLPLFGQPKTEGLIDVFGQVNGSTTAYRFWPGNIHFKQSILISTEHGNQNDTPANYS